MLLVVVVGRRGRLLSVFCGVAPCAWEPAGTGQVLQVHKAFLKRKRPLYAKRQEAIAEVPDFWLKVVS